MEHCKADGYEDMAQYLTEDINGRLIIGLRDVSHTMRALYEGKGSQKRVLMVLCETGTITQRELTQRLGIQPGSASEVIAKLEHAGLVQRSASEQDRRTADISLTETGRQQARYTLQQRQQRHEEMFSALSDAEKEQLVALLEKVNADWQKRYQDRYQDRRPPVEDHDHHHEGHHDRCDRQHHGHDHHHGHDFVRDAGREDHGHRHGPGEAAPAPWAEGEEGAPSAGQSHAAPWAERDQVARCHCDHDCANCPHPCGRGQKGRV